ncbi:MAG TPA: MarR family transcriptional regulator [Solirubrobacteraceae bacterium]
MEVRASSPPAGPPATPAAGPPAGPPAGAEDFLLAFETMAQAVRRARGAVAQDTPGRLTLSQYSLLLPLSGSDTARVSDLAAGAGIAPSTASRILDALERRAIVRRTRSEVDRRGVTVTLTEHGREALGHQHEWMRRRQLEFYEGLPEDEQLLVSDLLVRLAALIDELSCGPVA